LEERVDVGVELQADPMVSGQWRADSSRGTAGMGREKAGKVKEVVAVALGTSSRHSLL